MISFATVAFKAGAGTGTLDIALRAHCHFLGLLCRPNLNPKLSLFLMFIGILCIHSLLNFLGYLLLECSNSKWDIALRAHCLPLARPAILCQADQALPACLATLSLEYSYSRPLGNGQQGRAKMSPFGKQIHSQRTDKHENSTVCTFCKLFEPRGGAHGKPGWGPHGAARDKVRRMNGKGAATPDRLL